MLAQSGEPFDSPDFLFEIKWDGTRCLAIVDDDRFQLQNRRFIEMRDRYPELHCLKALPAGTVLDGEIVVLDGGKPNFNKLQQREHLSNPTRIDIARRQLPATFVAFDILYHGGIDVMGQALEERRGRLSDAVAQVASPHVIVSEAIDEHGRALFEQIEGHGIEGIMAKRRNSRYLPGKRSRDWLKIKVARTGEFDVLGYVQREGEPVISALLIGETYRRRRVYKGKVGTGFSEKDRARLFSELNQVAALPDAPDDGPAEAVWKAAGWRCRVRYFEKTPTGKLRAPVYAGRVED